MSELSETYEKSNRTADANATSHYVLIIVAVIIGLLGIFLRFLGNWAFIGILSNILLIIGVIVALKSVANILK